MNITVTLNLGVTPELKDLLMQGVSALVTLAASEAAAPRTAGGPSDLSQDRQTQGKTGGRRKAADKAAPAAPADPEPAEAAQDAADEAAESEAKAEEAAAELVPTPPEVAGDAAVGEVFNGDTMRKAGGEYARIYGMPAAQEDGPKIIGYKAFSAVPEADFAKVTLAMRAAIADNPYGRPVVQKAAA